jgi:hypothetical protein
MADLNCELLIIKYNELYDFLINNNHQLTSFKIIEITHVLQKTKLFIDQCEDLKKYVIINTELLSNSLNEFPSKL